MRPILRGGGAVVAEIAERDVRTRFVDKDLIRRIVAEQNERMGFVPDPGATAEQAQAMTRALGIPPEANALSSEIVAARDE
jgi:hypothetical protein